MMISGVRHLVLFLILYCLFCLACDLFFTFWLWLVVKDDAFRKPPLRGCEFWFDFRTGSSLNGCVFV